jgi:hypothetical protein
VPRRAPRVERLAGARRGTPTLRVVLLAAALLVSNVWPPRLL